MFVLFSNEKDTKKARSIHSTLIFNKENKSKSRKRIEVLMLKIACFNFLSFFLILNSYAQVVNSGGGGPDHGQVGNKPSDEVINARILAERIESVEKNLQEWITLAKEDWNQCYTRKLKVKNILELYAMMNLQGATNPPKLKKKQIKNKTNSSSENCEETDSYDCFFQNEYHNTILYRIISEKSFHDYLKEKDIDKEESRDQFIKYFKEKIK